MSAERVTADQTSTFPRFLDLAYPNIQSGDGVWLQTSSGEKILDACSGGAMVSSLGNGATDIVEAGAKQAERIASTRQHCAWHGNITSIEASPTGGR